MNFLASPPLVVAYALAGTMHVDLLTDPLGTGSDGQPVYLRDIWPSTAEIDAVVDDFLQAEMFTASYADVFAGDESWRALAVPGSRHVRLGPDSTYVRQPPYFDGMPREPQPLTDITGARVLAMLGDSVTTDHISPAGAIKYDSPAGQVPDRARRRAQGLQLLRVPARQPRGDDPRHLRQHPAAQPAGARHRGRLHPRLHPTGRPVSTIFDASVHYLAAGTPLVIIAGKEYGSGSSRDWAAKGTLLLGVKAVLAESFERIHRSNLIGMGVLPLQFPDGTDADSLGLTGEETFDITGVTALGDAIPDTVHVKAGGVEFDAKVRIDTPGEADYYRNGGIMQYVLRQLLD